MVFATLAEDEMIISSLYFPDANKIHFLVTRVRIASGRLSTVWNFSFLYANI